MNNRLPDCFALVATSEDDPNDKREELFYRNTYQHEADRVFEASQFAERMANLGFVVEYIEQYEVDRL